MRRAQFAADTRDMTASGMRERELTVEVAQPRRQPPSIHLRQQNGRGSLDHRYGSVAQNIESRTCAVSCRRRIVCARLA